MNSVINYHRSFQGRSIPALLIILSLVCSDIAAEVLADKDRFAIQQPGHLRILYHLDKEAIDVLPASVKDREMIEEFAMHSRLTTEWVQVDEPWQLMAKLLSGAGDIISGQDETLAAGMIDQVNFTFPWMSSQQQVVARSHTTRIDSMEDLFYRQIAIKKSSPAWPMLEKFTESNRSMEIIAIPESMTNEEIMIRVASGQYDVTIANSEFLNTYLPYHTNLSVVFNITDANLRAWAVRPNAIKLKTALNRFLNKNYLPFSVEGIYLDDLSEIKKRRVIRIITYKNSANYYFNQGRQRGFEYELLRKFAEDKRLRVDIVLADTHDDMQKLLLGGHGDIIAASLPEDSIKDERIKFSTPYNYSAPVIVGHVTDKKILDIRDLSGKRIILPAESPYQTVLEDLQERGIHFEIINAEQGTNTSTALLLVSMGIYDLTILGSHQVETALAGQFGMKAHFMLNEPGPVSWAVRSGNTRLLSALNTFVKNNYRSKMYNVLYEKYFENPKVAINKLLVQDEQLSPYDEIVKKYAEQYGFDWRLIVAQMYQESQFDPKAISYAGAEGLMQIIPETADYLGMGDTYNPTNSIRSGVRYLNILRGQFENSLLLEDITWFSLAAYNAGFTRVERARYLAEEMGLDKNRWFGNVEKAMLALAKPKKINGIVKRYCRCGQAVVYVREIRTLYNNYVRFTQTLRVAGIEPIKRSPYDI